MKKILTLGITALVLITMSSCQFNLFAAFDKIDVVILDVATASASEKEDFIEDVQEYVDTGSITEDNSAEVIAALDAIYTSPPDVETGQKAAILAGSISIDTDPEAKDAVNGIVAIALAGTTDLAAVKSIFPTNETEFYKMLDSMAAASDAYINFESTLVAGDAAFTLSDVERGDIAQYAIVSIIITEIVNTVLPADLYTFVSDPNATTLAGYEDPFVDVGSATVLQAYLDFAGIVI